MISLTLSGGLGNQLFMYAASRALALRNKTDLAINITYGFANDWEYKRVYELGCFNVKFKHSRITTFDYLCGNFIRSLSRKVGVNILCPWIKYVLDPTNNKYIYYDLLQNCNKNLYLEGYWQSEEYFKDFEDQIREDLEFNFEKSQILIDEEKTIFGQEDITPICVGFRLYQDCTHKMSFEVTQADYYIRAMDYMMERIPNAIFYVFTQAKDWVKENIESLGKYRIVYIQDKPSNASVEDLYLMSRFQYHIISNSSFYWWGAWLAKGKIVISNNNFINSKSNCEKWIIL